MVASHLFSYSGFYKTSGNIKFCVNWALWAISEFGHLGRLGIWASGHLGAWAPGICAHGCLTT